MRLNPNAATEWREDDHAGTRYEGADWRPPPRVKNPAVYQDFHAVWDACLACGNRHIEAAHLLRGNEREDVLSGLIPLCHGCHECFDKRMPYRGDFGHWFTPEFVDAKVARFLRHESGEDHRAYINSVRGPFGAEHYCLRLEGELT